MTTANDRDDGRLTAIIPTYKQAFDQTMRMPLPADATAVIGPGGATAIIPKTPDRTAMIPALSDQTTVIPAAPAAADATQVLGRIETPEEKAERQHAGDQRNVFAAARFAYLMFALLYAASPFLAWAFKLQPMRPQGYLWLGGAAALGALHVYGWAIGRRGNERKQRVYARCLAPVLLVGTAVWLSVVVIAVVQSVATGVFGS